MTHASGRVLIVDDSPIDAHILCNLLSDMADVTIVDHPEKALARLYRENYDVILLDVMMHGDEAGFDVCRRVRNCMPQHNDTPIVFVTGLDDSESEARGLEMGALDFITKPFAAAVVRARVGNYMALAQAQRRLKEANAELKRLSARDELTGISNRRHFQEMAEMDLSRADRSQQPVSVLLLDLDHFKRINDAYGHAAGDAVLCAVAGAWRHELRCHDVLARIGGEEFAVLLPDCSAPQAELLARRLVAATRKLRPLKGTAEDVAVTVSIGVATRLANSPTDLSGLLMAADTALYAAKREGRDRLVVASGTLALTGPCLPPTDREPAPVLP